MKKVGLFFGSFNPIHIGHLIIANHLVEHTDLNEIWFVVTPHNPHKEKKSLLKDHHRLMMVRMAVENYPKLKACKIEFDLPQPNYTINTLTVLQEKYPNTSFYLLMGEDNLAGLKRWKNYESILEYYHIYIYPRIHQGKVPPDLKNHPHVHYAKAPIIGISATQIRKDILEGKNVRPLLPPEVFNYIEEMNFYKK
jgi:nicotinate-nucleotide adenylyltransferase